MYCSRCQAPMADSAFICPDCGQPQPRRQGMYAETYQDDKNALAIPGFVLALVGLFLPVAVLDLLVAAAGGVMSVLALRKTAQRGFAIAGIIIAVLAVLMNLFLLVFEPDVYRDAWDLQ